MVPSAFVRVLFPTREKPHRPGLPHIGYVLGIAAGYAMVAYTTSQPWPADTPLPAGVQLFDAREAEGLNQSHAFLLRLDVLAKLPLTPAWFPGMEQPDEGIVAIAPAGLRSELAGLATNLARRRHELLEMRGP